MTWYSRYDISDATVRYIYENGSFDEFVWIGTNDLKYSDVQRMVG